MGVGGVGKEEEGPLEEPASFLRTFINRVGEGLKIVPAMGEGTK